MYTKGSTKQHGGERIKGQLMENSGKYVNRMQGHS